jgi:CDP-diacylglycerol---glycerol-3-phosphate 3-phosphatidyltransferase
MKVREIFQDKIFTISNLLTALRIFAGPLLGYFIYLESKTGEAVYLKYEIAVVIGIILSDFFDGKLARWMNQVTKLGQYMDPIADKFAALIAMTALVLYKGFPLWVYILAMTREILAVIVGISLYVKKDIEVKPNIFGKLCAGCLAFSGAVYIMSLDYEIGGVTLKQLSIFLVVMFYVLGGILYVKTYARSRREQKV